MTTHERWIYVYKLQEASRLWASASAVKTAGLKCPEIYSLLMIEL
jgi:hypothetical protein